MAIYSSGSNPLADVRLPPPRGRGVNCALRLGMRDAVVLLLPPPGRAMRFVEVSLQTRLRGILHSRDADTNDADRERAEGKGGREFVETV